MSRAATIPARRAAGWSAAIVLVAALLASALTARLGVWQLSRASEKIALQTAIDERSHEAELPAAALARTIQDAPAQHYRPIRLHGHWLASHTVYLDNRQMNAQPGFYVVTPLQLGPGDAVLVQRGWVPRNSQDRTQLPPVVTPAGEVDVRGLIAPPPSRLFDFGKGERGAIRQNVDLDEMSREIGIALRPVSIQQSDDAGAGHDALLRQWPHVAVDVSKHYGYAFQWFAMSALIAGLYVWFQLVRPRLRRKD